MLASVSLAGSTPVPRPVAAPPGRGGPPRVTTAAIRGSLAAAQSAAAASVLAPQYPTRQAPLTGSLALRQARTWLVAEHGAAAVTDLAEELAADLAEALDALAAAEGRPALAVLDGWFDDVPPPWGGRPTTPQTATTADPDETPRGRADGQKPTRREPAS
jgi:hypothetical protein